MFLRAGALSLALLLASRVLGLLRESAQAAAFGASGLADVVVVMLTLPDWVAGILASGALAYVLVPAWAGQARAQVATSQRKVARGLVVAACALALLLGVGRGAAVQTLMPGIAAGMSDAALQAMLWSAVALPAALLAALWTTRLQHERDFTGMYSANLVVNAVLVLAIVAAARTAADPVLLLGGGLMAAMLVRLAWLHWRTPVEIENVPPRADAALRLPAPPIWLWAALSAGLPLALPFAARSLASQEGAGALATFNYAWKLVELPLVLAIQLVATLAFPAIARAAAGAAEDLRAATRTAMALAWTLACACVAGLLVGAPAIARLLFGWGRMDEAALSRIANWGTLGAWSLLPQAVIAVALTVLAAQSRMKVAVAAYAIAVAVLVAAGASGWHDGGVLMMVLDGVLVLVAAVVLSAMGQGLVRALPWKAMTIALGCLLVIAAAALYAGPVANVAAGLAAATMAALFVLGTTWVLTRELRIALAR